MVVVVIVVVTVEHNVSKARNKPLYPGTTTKCEGGLWSTLIVQSKPLNRNVLEYHSHESDIGVGLEQYRWHNSFL